MLLTSSGFVYSYGNPDCCGHEENENPDEPKLIYDLIDIFVSKIQATSFTSMALGRARDSESPIEISLKRIVQNEDINDSD